MQLYKSVALPLATIVPTSQGVAKLFTQPFWVWMHLHGRESSLSKQASIIASIKSLEMMGFFQPTLPALGPVREHNYPSLRA